MSQEVIRDLIDMLVAKYPATFSIKDRKPLKIGIHKDLIAAEPEIAALGFPARRKLLSTYCGHRFYLKNVIAGVDRVDLNGEPTGKPTDEHIVEARRQLASYYEYLRAKKAAAKVQAKPVPIDKPAAQPVPPPAPGPKRISLADLRAAAAARKGATVA
jgi:ProP effector